MNWPRTRFKWVFCGGLSLLLTLLLTVPGWASSTGLKPGVINEEPLLDLGTSQAAPASTAPGLGSAQEVEAFMDSFFATEIAAKSAPGGAVAVVKDGEILFAKGYGYADLEQKTPVDAERTLFRVASLSKLVTATATMQLQEQGLLNLDDDINQYLGERVQLKNPYPQPVTFAQLLTHTDGSTKRRIGLAAESEDRLQPLENYLADHLPPIVYPPGKLFSYSSHSIALLGYLVQQIANQPFVDYIHDHILQPLAMYRSSFAQPPPAAIDLATGYQKRGDRFEPVPYLYLNIGPGAALSSTAIDMAHFMIAHLQEGRYKNNRILQPETVVDMHRIHFRSHPALPGTGYGFRERRINGMQVVGHLGSLRGYSSSLTLLPEQNIGLFVASNSFSGLHRQLLRQFFDRYFPPVQANLTKAESLSPINPAELDLTRFVGTYRDLEYPRHTWVKLSAPFQHIHIRRSGTGLVVQAPWLFFRQSKSPSQLEPLTPMLFRQTDNGALTAFGADDSGNIVYAYNPIFAKMGTYIKISWYENIWFQAGLVIVITLLFISGLWIWPLRPLLQRRSGNPKYGGKTTDLAWQIAGLVSGLNLFFLVGFPVSLWLYGGWKLAYGMPWFSIVLLALPSIAALLTVAMLGFALWPKSQNKWSKTRRWHYGLLTSAASVWVVLLAYWRILGFQF